jgi:pimeloyl-ACP methyl ester carboxylesterase
MMWSALKSGPDGMAQFAKQDGPITPTWEARIRANDFEALRAFFTSPGLANDRLDKVPPTIKAPCILIVGDDDFNSAAVQKCAEQMPTATLVVLPGVGHSSAFMRSDLVLPHVKAFLNRIDGGAS